MPLFTVTMTQKWVIEAASEEEAQHWIDSIPLTTDGPEDERIEFPDEAFTEVDSLD